MLAWGGLKDLAQVASMQMCLAVAIISAAAFSVADAQFAATVTAAEKPLSSVEPRRMDPRTAVRPLLLALSAITRWFLSYCSQEMYPS